MFTSLVELMVVPNCLADQIRAYVVKMWKLGPENYVPRFQPRPIQAYTATLLTHVEPKLQLSKSQYLAALSRPNFTLIQIILNHMRLHLAI